MNTITIGQYLINRLKEVGVETIFGVPGDYNMPLLDIIEDDPSLTWGNNANELNASYAADGYARIKGVGCVVTTFGVGELSAATGIAGSYSEMIPVIHIVGTPKTQSQASGAILHHSLGNSDFRVFLKMFSEITCIAHHLSKENPASKIDQVIRESILQKRPGYIGIPIDLIQHPIEIQLEPLKIERMPNPVKTQEVALEVVSEAIRKAQCPVIILDGCVSRHGLGREASAFVRHTGFPTYVAPMGKCSISEELPNYRGCYVGTTSLKPIDDEVHSADLVIEIGSIKSDINTGGFSYGFDRGKTISLHSFVTKVFYADYENVGMTEFLPLLTKRVEPKSIDMKPRHEPNEVQEGTEITHNYFWNKVPDYMVPQPIVIVDMGTGEFSSFNMRTPPGTTFIAQVLWGSIGFSVGATLGACAAARDRQVYLFCGDGSFQMTCQEVSVMLHHGYTPVIFILNNDGYLIETLIRGAIRKYNSFQMWEYSKTLSYFGAHLEINRNTVGIQAKVETRNEFELVMNQVAQQPNKIHFIEVVMPKFDAPQELILHIQNCENR